MSAPEQRPSAAPASAHRGAARRLLRRFVRIFALAGLLLGALLLVAAVRLQQRGLEEGVRHQAEEVARALQRASERGVAGQDLIRLAQDLGSRDAALVDVERRVVTAASRPGWLGPAPAALPAPLTAPPGRLLRDGSATAYGVSLPVALAEAGSEPRMHRVSLLLDGGHVAAASAATLSNFVVATLLGVILLGVAVCGLLGRSVLRPLLRMQEVQEEAIRRSEERLQLAVAGSTDALFDYDPRHRTLYVSDVFRRWMGGSSDERRSGVYDADAVLSRVLPEHVERTRSAFLACASTGHPFDVEFEVRRPGGGSLWVQARGRGVPVEPGVYRVSGFASDISRRKVAENLLHDSVDRLGAVLDNIAEGIITLNRAGEVCAVNEAARQMFGFARDDLVGRPLAALLELPEGASDWGALADRQPREGLCLPQAGRRFPAEFAVSTMRVRSDERFIVVLRDISERRVAEDRLRRAMEETQAATRAKDEFLATMSHEIRTPMNGVLGMTQLLLDMELTPRQRETAQLIRSSGESLLDIINDILDFSRAGSGRLKIDTVEFDLRQAIREVVELLGRRRSGVDVYVDYPGDLPGRLIGDPGRVRQVLMNLVGNALKFTESGHVVVSVSSCAGTPAAPGRAHLEIAVEDTGPGIPHDAQLLLFEPFTQADASTTRRFGGTGLGLAISRRLVELMGGEIGFHSRPGEGSRFHFSLNLPCQPVPPPGPPPVLAKRRILVVNDDPRGRDILCRHLEWAGMVPVSAASGAAAMEHLERQGFDVVLVDEHMPGMDGALLCELIRVDAAWRGMAVVLLCGPDPRDPDRRDPHPPGPQPSPSVDRYIPQPVVPDVLLDSLADLLERAARRGAQAPPDAVVAAPQAAAPARAEHLPGQTSPGAPGQALPGKVRVLLAEDNLVNQQVAVRMLEKSGCRVDVAADGVEALEMWRHFGYDLVFMDCQMPQLDGLEATRRIRQEEARRRRPRTPIVALTANAMHQDRADCLGAGMDDYLSKPVTQADLAAVLQRWRPAGPQRRAAG